MNLNNTIQEKLMKYDNTTGYMNSISHRSLVRKLYESEFEEFEEVLLGEDPFNFFEIMNEKVNKISGSAFSAFLDTEKIHIQFAMCSFGAYEDVPVIAYFGYGNYYPFSTMLKNKNDRFMRFSQLNSSDEIKVDHFLNEIKKSKLQKSNELKSKINECQKSYRNHFENNLNFSTRRERFINKYGENGEYPEYVDRLMMLEPAIRTKSAALVAYDYNFYK